MAAISLLAGMWEFRTGNTFGRLSLWAWGIFTAYMFVASLRTTAAIALVFLLLASGDARLPARRLAALASAGRR